MRFGPILLGILLMFGALFAGVVVLMSPDLAAPGDPAFGPNTPPEDWDDGTIRLDRWAEPETPSDWLTEKDKIALSLHPTERVTEPADEVAKTYLTYRSRRGETLPTIAAKFLGDSSLFGALVSHNPGILKPGLEVAAGTTIRIPLWLRRGQDEEPKEVQLTEHGYEALERSDLAPGSAPPPRAR